MCLLTMVVKLKVVKLNYLLVPKLIYADLKDMLELILY